jgi:hypothetical protein
MKGKAIPNHRRRKGKKVRSNTQSNPWTTKTTAWQGSHVHTNNNTEC